MKTFIPFHISTIPLSQVAHILPVLAPAHGVSLTNPDACLFEHDNTPANSIKIFNVLLVLSPTGEITEQILCLGNQILPGELPRHIKLPKDKWFGDSFYSAPKLAQWYENTKNKAFPLVLEGGACISNSSNPIYPVAAYEADLLDVQMVAVKLPNGALHAIHNVSTIITLDGTRMKYNSLRNNLDIMDEYKKDHFETFRKTHTPAEISTPEAV